MTCGLLTTQGYSASAYSCGGSYGIELNNSHHIPIHIQKCNEMLSKASLTAIVNEVNRMNKQGKPHTSGKIVMFYSWLCLNPLSRMYT